MGFIPLHSGRPARMENWTSGNAGLRYDKYLDAWSGANEAASVLTMPKLDEEERARFFRESKRECGDALELSSYLDRRYRLLAVLGGRILRGITQWRFVSGLGAAHPLETGFVWHRTLGVPYLPGSSVKGMMRAWVHHWLGHEQRAEELFGSADKESPNYGLGKLIVFDALPLAPVHVESDIMNPHYPDYYKDESGTVQPSDDQSPIPLQFLAVAANQRFEFAIAPASDQCTPKELEEAIQILKDAAHNIGAGAKTAVGYGVFKLDAPDESADPVRQLVEERQQEEELEELERLSPFEQLLVPFKQFLQPDEVDAGEKDAAADAAARFFNEHDELDSFSGNEQVDAARILKEVWIKAGKWPARKVQKKQREREAKVRKILGEQP